MSTTPLSMATPNKVMNPMDAERGIPCMPGSNLSNFAKTLQKGQRITLEGKIKYREVSEEADGVTFKHIIAEIHATSLKRLSKVEAADDPADGASEDDGAAQKEPEIISPKNGRK